MTTAKLDEYPRALTTRLIAEQRRRDPLVDGMMTEGERRDALFEQFVAAIVQEDRDEAERLGIEVQRSHWRMQQWLKRLDKRDKTRGF